MNRPTKHSWKASAGHCLAYAERTVHWGKSMSHYHALVWIDHTEAHVMHISPDDVEKSLIHPNGSHNKLHAHAGALGSGRAPENQDYYHRVANALAGAQEILIVGPAQAKLQLIKHIHGHAPALAAKVIGVETVDHPSDGQLVAYARKYFLAKDQML
ncbi:MAG: translational machinery protein [Rhodoferax sp.]